MVLSQDQRLQAVASLASSLSCQRAWVEVDCGAIAHNVRALRRVLGACELLAVVKADAYGHGAVTVARAALAAGASWLAVATVPEGAELRAAGIDAPILLLGAVNTAAEAIAVRQWQLEPTLCTAQQAQAFAAALAGATDPLPVHLKLDTGMSRLGTLWTEAVEFARGVAQLPELAIASVYSHLATADDPDPRTMHLQHQRYRDAIAAIRAAGIEPPRLHLANSAATLSGDPSLHYDMVRVGLALYGLFPGEHLRGTVPLRPALQVKARVTQVKTIPAGAGVSYGHRFVAPQPTRIAVVGIGYADGVPRNLSGQLQAIARGRKVPQLGAVTMDQIIFDVSTVPEIAAGETVVLLGSAGGETISADDWAEQLGTISWEILCGFRHRLPRVPIAAG